MTPQATVAPTNLECGYYGTSEVEDVRRLIEPLPRFCTMATLKD